VHAKHNPENRTVLEYRDEKGKKEPWTWVRMQGKGHVFYTAWGHDERTWSNPGFKPLVERGIRWAVGKDPTVTVAFTAPIDTRPPEMTSKRSDVKPFEYQDAKVPFYPPGPTWGKQTEPLSKMQKPLDAEESQKHLVTPVGFEAKLFAADPDIYRPICMNWDERGRLWIAETLDYPNEMTREGEGRDRIVICEDTKGAGRADKFTVFADKLSIPTSFTFHKDGIIVAQAPHMLFLRSTKRDDHCDERKILFTGWGTSDTHSGPSNLQFGFDNWIYGMVGYSGFRGTVGGESLRFQQGMFRFKPDGSKLEFLASTSNNSWGLGFSEDGSLFGSTANGNPSVHLAIPNRYYEKVRGMSPSVLPMISEDNYMHPITEKVRQVDWHGKFTAGCGHAVYTARTYPKEYWNRTAFVCEPTGHLVSTFTIEPNGATYKTKNSWNLLASDDEWTAPIMAEVGPDGNVWVIDWYNYIVQHNPTPQGFKNGRGNAYETPLRDKSHGRIYRIVHKDGKPSTITTLKDATPQQLVNALGSDNLFWRRHAQRLLVEQGGEAAVIPLRSLLAEPKLDSIGLDVGSIHGLWTLKGLGDSRPQFDAALRNRSAAVRRAGALVAPQDANSVRRILEAKLLDSPEPLVQMAALTALADLPASEAAASAILEHLNAATGWDRWRLDAAAAAAAANDSGFLSAFLRSPKSSPAAASVAEKIAENYARNGGSKTSIELLGAMASAPLGQATPILHGFDRGWPAKKLSAEEGAVSKALVSLLKSMPASERSKVISLAKRWGDTSLDQQIAEIADGYRKEFADEKANDADRVGAAARFVDLQRKDVAAVKEVLAVLSPQISPQLAKGIVEAVGQSDSVEAGAELGKTLPSLTPTVRAEAIRVMLSRSDWSGSLLDLLDKNSVQPNDLSLDQRQNLANHPTKSVADRAKTIFSRGGGLPNADRQKVVDELMPLTLKTGDAALGKLVFKNNCAKCHIHSGEGAKIGPELTGMAVHPKSHLLIEIMDPNRSVEGNYRMWVAVLKSGKVVQGLLASESKSAIELVNAEAQKIAIQREDLDELTATTKSLMPEGFEKQLKADDVVNLLEFLTARGKYLPLPIEKLATSVSTKGMFFDPQSDFERMTFSDWGPKTFEGVPFRLVDPHGDKTPNVILFYGPNGTQAPKMPKSVELPINSPVAAIHLLSGVGGWAAQAGGAKKSVSLTAKIRYADGATEDHPLRNGVEFADYVGKFDVPGSKFAFALSGGKQIRYLAIRPKRAEPIAAIDFVRGNDSVAPIIMAVTLEFPTPPLTAEKK
ncbi:MAG TPA: PVC-type heme-binding CxxCH protein, partial [Gemmataceae bacterium]|nr:PVC-type heme-binding CxxCH protein [Gemmataceae bacterium]